MAVRDKNTIPEKKEEHAFIEEGRELEGVVLNESSLGEGESLGLRQPLVGRVVAGPGENLPFPCWGV